jgi:hypothetical protein
MNLLLTGHGLLVEIKASIADRTNLFAFAILTIRNLATFAFLRSLVEILVVCTDQANVFGAVIAVFLAGLTLVVVEEKTDFAAKAVESAFVVRAMTAMKVATLTRLACFIVQEKVTFANRAFVWVNGLVAIFNYALLASVGILVQNKAILANHTFEGFVIAALTVGWTGFTFSCDRSEPGVAEMTFQKCRVLDLILGFLAMNTVIKSASLTLHTGNRDSTNDNGFALGNVVPVFAVRTGIRWIANRAPLIDTRFQILGCEVKEKSAFWNLALVEGRAGAHSAIWRARHAFSLFIHIEAVVAKATSGLLFQRQIAKVAVGWTRHASFLEAFVHVEDWFDWADSFECPSDRDQA